MSALNKHKHMNSDKSVGAAFLIIIGVFALVAGLWLYGVFAYGFVLAKLWAWFVIPIGTSALGVTINQIGILQAAAICMIVRFVWPTNLKIDSTDERPVSDKVAEVFAAIIVPWMALFCAWVLKGMM
jgi:hypothetical protein